MTFTECGGSVRPYPVWQTVEAESPDFSHGEYVKGGGVLFDRPMDIGECGHSN